MSYIITRLKGGMGNQLFQYALGRALSLRHGVPLKLDVTTCLPDSKREYALAPLLPAAEFATAEEIAAATPVVEQGMAFQTGPFTASPPLLLDGYWQSERYFEDCAERLRTELRATWLCRTPRSGTAIVHVRRGDFVTVPDTIRQQPLTPRLYYYRAAAIVMERVPDVQFLMVSDDPQWCRDNLPWLLLNTPAPAAALQGMSMHEHAIIPNSTFGWWGAWLGGDRPDRMVVAPKAWFTPASGLDDRDIVPARWLRC